MAEKPYFVDEDSPSAREAARLARDPALRAAARAFLAAVKAAHFKVKKDIRKFDRDAIRLGAGVLLDRAVAEAEAGAPTDTSRRDGGATDSPT